MTRQMEEMMPDVTPVNEDGSLEAFRSNNTSAAATLIVAAEKYYKQMGFTTPLPSIKLLEGQNIDNKSLRDLKDDFVHEESRLQTNNSYTPGYTKEKAIKVAGAIKESAELLLNSEVIADNIASGKAPFDSVNKIMMNNSAVEANNKARQAMGR